MTQRAGISGAGQGPATPEIELPLGEYIVGVQDRVNQGIEGYLEGVDPDFRDMFEHALGGEAPKRLRPALAYMTGDTLGVPREDIDELALVVELIHSASLAMDDLPGQDDSNLRRGQEALHVRFGVGQAEITAIAMLAEAGRIAIGTDARHALGGRLASHVMESVGSQGMSLGQLRDIESAGQDMEEIAEEELDEINWLKTGTAVEMSAVGAAIIGELPEDIIRILRQYSYHMGIAHQVQDDLWDGTKTVEEIGKPTGIDERNRKPTYLSTLGEQGAREKASRHGQAALVALDDLPERYNPVKLREVAGFLIGK